MDSVTLTVNGASRRLDSPPGESLLTALRERLGLTGTKYGCGIGQCGACTVLLDGKAVRSCRTKASEAVGRLQGHVCRCGTYPRIVEAVRLAERAGRKG